MSIYYPNNYTDKPKAFDFFCGIGGFSLGLMQAGFEVVGAMDNSPDAFYTYVANLGKLPINVHYTSLKYQKLLTANLDKKFKGKENLKESDVRTGWIKNNPEIPGVSNFIFGDIKEVDGEWIMERLGLTKPLDLVVGGPPCQGFSSANSKASKNDPRNELVFEYIRLVTELQPLNMVMEEVPAILNYTTPEGIPIIDAVTHILEYNDYGSFEAISKFLRNISGAGVVMKTTGKEREGKKQKPINSLELFK